MRIYPEQNCVKWGKQEIKMYLINSGGAANIYIYTNK